MYYFTFKALYTGTSEVVNLVHTCGIIKTGLWEAVINVLFTVLSSVSWGAGTGIGVLVIVAGAMVETWTSLTSIHLKITGRVCHIYREIKLILSLRVCFCKVIYYMYKVGFLKKGIVSYITLNTLNVLWTLAVETIHQIFTCSTINTRLTCTLIYIGLTVNTYAFK